MLPLITSFCRCPSAQSSPGRCTSSRRTVGRKLIVAVFAEEQIDAASSLQNVVAILTVQLVVNALADEQCCLLPGRKRSVAERSRQVKPSSPLKEA